MNFSILPKDEKSSETIVKKWIICFFFITLLLQIWRIFSLNATYDQGLFLQEIWNGIHGRSFESTLASELSAPVMFEGALPQVGYRHLAQHFTPLLVIWIPLVHLLGTWALPLIQVTLITSAGWILFLFASIHLPKRLAGWITCSFYSTGVIIGPSLENFHDLCAVPILVFTLLLGISKNQKFLYLLPALLLPWIREDVGLLTFSIGIWMVIRVPGWRLLGLGLCTYSLISVVIITNQIMPIFGSELTDRFIQERFSQYLNGENGGPIQVLLSMARQPLLLINELISPAGKSFLFLITFALPLAFIPWLSIDSWLLIIVPLFVALSSKGGNALAVTLRFVLYLVPGTFAGAVLWWKRKKSLFYNLNFRRFWKLCLIIAFFFALAGNPHRSLSAIIPDSVNPWVHVPITKQWKRGLVARELIKPIPQDLSIAAETHLIPQLARRRILLRFPENYRYIDTDGEEKSVDLIITQPRFNGTYAKAFRHYSIWVERSFNRMSELTKSKEYGILKCDNKGIILKKGIASKSKEIICFENELNDSKNIEEYAKAQ